MSVLLIAAVTIHQDPDAQKRYEGYVAGGIVSLEKYGGEVLASDEMPEAIEGALPGKKIVVIRFRDRDHLQEWYNSPEYQQALPHRLENGDTAFVLMANELG